MSQLIDSLEWRYSTKTFDTTKKVSDSDIAELKESLRLSASAFGQQPYRFVCISSQELKDRLRPASWNQPSVEQCSHLFVFCLHRNFGQEQIDQYADLMAEIRNTDAERIERYKAYLGGYLSKLNPEQTLAWGARQSFIAMGSLLTACALMRIDSCPLEGIEPEKYDQILGLEELGLTTIAAVAVGYRAEDDAQQHLAKVRKPAEYLFIDR